MAAESAVRVIFLGDSAQAVRSVSRLEGSFASLGRTSKLVAGALGVALVGGMIAATKAAIDFQHQMELIHTQAGASAAEVDKMSKALLKMAASVGTGPEDLAKGLFHIESAGIRGAKALAILRAAAEGAKVGQADLETVTNALIGAFKSGVKGAGDMQHTMGILNAIVGAGNMRMNDLTSAMGTGLLSAAKGVGISIQDVGAAVAELTVQNENASEAATRLQMAFLTMAANTTKGATALKSIGISQNQLATDMRSRGLIFALQDLQTHLKDSGKTAVEQTAIIADVFGRRSLKAILPLLQHLDDVRKRQEQINATTDNFGNAWVATTQTVSFQLQRAKAAIQAAFIPIGTLLLPLVSALAQGIGGLAQMLGQTFAPAMAQAFGEIHKASDEAVAGIREGWSGRAPQAVEDATGRMGRGLVVGGQSMTRFQEIAKEVASVAREAWAQIRTEAEKLGPSLGGIFRSVEQIIQALAPVLQQLAPEFKVAFGLALLAVRVAVAAIALQLRVASAVIRAVAPVVAALAADVNKAFGQIVQAAKGVASGIADAFNSVVGAIKTVVDWIQTLIGWISKIPHDISIHVHVPGSGIAGKIGGAISGAAGGLGGAISGVLPASGGIIPLLPGSTRGADSVPALLTPGEMVLNQSQQAMLGGQSYLAGMFNFGSMARFAAGGIVKPKRRHSSPSPHHPRHNRVRSKSRAANAILSALDEIDENESNADRAYGQLVRQFDITQEQFIRTDPATGTDYISQPDINQRVSEIDQLITARDNYLALLDEEKRELEKAVARLKKAIAALVKAIKHEREQAASDAHMIAVLGKQLGQEQAKKKPNPKIVNSLNAQITARGNSRSQHLSNVGTMSSTLTAFQGSLAGVQENLSDTLPMDRRDVTLDIATLQAERKDVTGTTLPTSSGGGGAGSAVGGPDVAALIAQIAQLNLALAIQGAQSGVIGSFAKGTLSVPQTGLALVHAGESITPAGQARGGGGGDAGPIHVNLTLGGPLEPLARFITATVDSPQVADRISVHIGRRATERARSSRA